MSKEKSEVVVLEKDITVEVESEAVITSTKSRKNSADNSVSQQLLKLAKTFVIDGGLLPEEKQMLIEDRTAKRLRLGQLRKQKNIESIMQKTLGYCQGVEVDKEPIMTGLVVILPYLKKSVTQPCRIYGRRF